MGLPKHEWAVLNRHRGHCADMMYNWRLRVVQYVTAATKRKP